MKTVSFADESPSAGKGDDMNGGANEERRRAGGILRSTTPHPAAKKIRLDAQAAMSDKSNRQVPSEKPFVPTSSSNDGQDKENMEAAERFMPSVPEQNGEQQTQLQNGVQEREVEETANGSEGTDGGTPSDDDQEQAAAAAEKEWMDALNGIRKEGHPEFTQNLDRFQAGMDNGKVLEAKLCKIFDVCKKNMEDVTEHLLKAVASSLHSNLLDRSTELENENSNLIVQNNAVRTEMVRTLQRNKASIDRLIADVLQQPHDPENDYIEDESQSFPSDGFKHRRPGNAKDANPENKEELQTHEEPDWAALLQHEPSHDNIEMFLNTREQSAAVEAEYQRMLEDVTNGMKGATDEILRVVFMVYSEMNEQLHEQEESIKELFASNLRRRNMMQQQLQEQMQQMQGYFAGIMSRITPSNVSLPSFRAPMNMMMQMFQAQQLQLPAGSSAGFPEGQAANQNDGSPPQPYLGC